jgi:ABC-type oligopeptide transport system ATPase subunit
LIRLKIYLNLFLGLGFKRHFFGFEKGKTNLIIGKSGSGKSVLTKCIVGLFEPDIGDVFYDDRNSFSFKI